MPLSSCCCLPFPFSLHSCLYTHVVLYFVSMMIPYQVKCPLRPKSQLHVMRRKRGKRNRRQEELPTLVSLRLDAMASAVTHVKYGHSVQAQRLFMDGRHCFPPSITSHHHLPSLNLISTASTTTTRFAVLSIGHLRSALGNRRNSHPRV